MKRLQFQNIEEPVLSSEHARLVRLCYRLTGDVDAVEDLAQETLLEALRNAHKLHDPSGYSRWLSAIARNVCMRWNHRKGRDTSRFIAPVGDHDTINTDDGYDLDVELDRHELAQLLDRAMAMLPPESREVLVERYVHESPHAETAARLGLTEAGVAKRLERGRLRLKRVLSTEMLHESVSHGLAESLFEDWEETDIWCPVCGRRRLFGKFMPGRNLWLICKPCNHPRHSLPVSHYSGGAWGEPVRGVRGYRATHLHGLARHNQRFERGVAGHTERCPGCGSIVLYRIERDSWDGRHFARVECERCQRGSQFKTPAHLLATPEGQRFWREHPRIRMFPDREIRTGGVPALVTGYESMTGSAKIEGVFIRSTFERIGVHVTPGS